MTMLNDVFITSQRLVCPIGGLFANDIVSASDAIAGRIIRFWVQESNGPIVLVELDAYGTVDGNVALRDETAV